LKSEHAKHEHTLKSWLEEHSLQSVSEILAKQNSQSLLFSGLPLPARALLIAKMWLENPSGVLLVGRDVRECERYADDLTMLLPENTVHLFPGTGIQPWEWRSLPDSSLEQRMEFFSSLEQNKAMVAVVPAQALLERFAKPEESAAGHLNLQTGQEYDLAELREELNRRGFREEPLVENVGEFSVRGGIVDVFPLMTDYPVRLDFFGDELESIREFDIFSQRSVRSRETVDIAAMEEFVFSDSWLEQGYARMQGGGISAEKIAAEREDRRRGNYAGVYWQRSWFEELPLSLADFFNQDVLVYCDEHSLLQTHLQRYWDKVETQYQQASQSDRVLSEPQELYWSVESVLHSLTESRGSSLIQWSEFTVSGEGTSFSGFQQFSVREQKRERSTPAELEKQLADLQNEGYEVWLLSANAGQAERLAHLSSGSGIAGVLVGELSSGIFWEDEKLALLTDHQLFNRFSRQVQKKVHRGGVAIPDFSSMQRGDFVIHERHGVGRYLGLKRIATASGQVDCLVVEYDGGDRLNLPVEELSRLEKYAGQDAEVPELHKLGGKKWSNLKKRVRKKVVEIARELVELYARRVSMEGHAFGPDSESQHEFEAEFPWEPTPDQIRAVEEIKKDMQSSKPMDRLVCGDVGFGKTEVAMRAAFKALAERKQVAVLVPTTVLAAQHLENFLERFASWPVQTEMLSRYRSAAEKKKIIKALSEHKIDILVGTHALLNAEVKYADLGLLIIDEEQKFGVKQKEKIRQMKLTVDTLSMSATPIPRTLHLSLSGARDISLINTPPRNRLPVETRIIQRDDRILAESVNEELERGGQVFVVHDRVASINKLAADVEQWSPGARVAVAHGQMNEKDLEQVMSAFLHHEFDVLVCTSIIESGLDVSNANTIIIHNAQNFGMSQLYQLRGRVGRSAVHARAWLVTPFGKTVSELSWKRLQAMERFTDLGSGYQLAMQDLELRGAGNLLGMEQSGFISEVGYETYLRMVKEAMAELKGDTSGVSLQPELDLPGDAYLPEDYIEDGMLRLSLYQKLSHVEKPEDLETIAGELQDRFGEVPEPAKNLLIVAEIRLWAARLGLIRVVADRELLLTFSEVHTPDVRSLSQWSEKSSYPLRFLMTDPLQIVAEIPRAEKQKLTATRDLLRQVGSGNSKKADGK